MQLLDIENAAEVNSGLSAKIKVWYFIKALERERKGYCDGTSGTHHTNYILHADWRLESCVPSWSLIFAAFNLCLFGVYFECLYVSVGIAM